MFRKLSKPQQKTRRTTSSLNGPSEQAPQKQSAP